MANYTKAQEKAIIYETNNILINAGAGSGKTTVLTQRIINKLLKGTKIDELLVLTFTNAAAQEMKERIIKEVKKHDNLTSMLPLIHISDIMTFDSLLLKLLKKYGYILDINKNVKIGDEVLLDKMLEEVINDNFEYYYEKLGTYLNSNKDFKKMVNKTLEIPKEDSSVILFFDLINNYYVFKDEELKKNIKYLYYSYNNILNKDELVSNNSYQKIEEQFSSYEKMLLSYIKVIKELANSLNKYMFDEELELEIKTYKEKLDPLISATSYDILVDVVNGYRLDCTRKKDEKYDVIKDVHKEIQAVYKKIKENLIISRTKKELLADEKQKEELKNFILNMLDNISQEYLIRKKVNNIYNFSDIMNLVLKILKENEEIRQEIRQSYKEILVDEYQDTNDFQNEFINLIQNDNLYLVGDVKQSIYGFRNTNPQNFNDLQQKYIADKSSGEVINLLHNFRSREEVLLSVNDMFEKLMIKELGMIDYKDNQALEYGNKTYDLKDSDIDYKMENYVYNLEDYEDFDKEHIEAYIVAKDIRNKIDNKHKVLRSGKLEDCSYNDFVILTRSKKTYVEYKKIFDYFNLPLEIQTEDVLNDKENYEIATLLNILRLVVNSDNKEAKVSILRSFLYAILEQDIYNYLQKDIISKEILDLELKIENIKSKDIRNLPLLLTIIYKEFNFFKYVVKLKNVELINYKLIKIQEVAQELTDNQKNIYDLIDYLEYSFNKEDIKVAINPEKNLSNCIKIMTIHKSKGLEFPIVYISQLANKISQPSKQLINIKNNILTLPKIEDYLKYKSFIDYTQDNKNKIDELNENIRLLYVAMTRAKEKIIFISSFKESSSKIEHPFTISTIYDLIYTVKNTMVETLVSKDEEDDLVYKAIKESFVSSNNLENKSSTPSNYKYKENENRLDFIDLKTSSKKINNLLTDEEKANIDMGITIHEYLEKLDFLQIYNYSYLEQYLSIVEKRYYDHVSQIINNLKNYKIIKQAINFYTEYEFYYENDNEQVNGIIDLIIETDDGLYIIDYKLKDITKEEYIDQVNTYKEVMKQYYNKDVYGYLYSLLNNEFKEVK